MDGILSSSSSKCWRHWFTSQTTEKTIKTYLDVCQTSDSFDLSGTAKVLPLHISAALLENTTKLKSEANLRKLNNYISLQRSINILHIRNNEHQWLQSILKKKSESNILRQKCAWVMKFIVKHNMNSNNTIYSPAVMHVSNCRNEL